MGIADVTSPVQRGTPLNGNVPRKHAHAHLHARCLMLVTSSFTDRKVFLFFFCSIDYFILRSVHYLKTKERHLLLYSSNTGNCRLKKTLKILQESVKTDQLTGMHLNIKQLSATTWSSGRCETLMSLAVGRFKLWIHIYLDDLPPENTTASCILVFQTHSGSALTFLTVSSQDRHKNIH